MLERKQLKTPYFQTIADRVKELMDEGLLLTKISEMLSTDRNTITAAARFWYESRGLEYQDGRARRKALRIKNRKK